MTRAADIALFIDPFSYHYQRDLLFDSGNEMLSTQGDDVAVPYVFLRKWFAERGVETHTADYLMRGEHLRQKNIYISIGMRRNYRAIANRCDVVLSAFFAFEGPIVEPELYRELTRTQRYVKRIFSFSDSESLQPFTGGPLHLHKFVIPQPNDTVHEKIWQQEERGFLVMINANKLPALYFQELYTERQRAVEFFGRTGDIDLYGKGWDAPPMQLGKRIVPATVIRIQRKVLSQWQRFHLDPLLKAARRANRGAVKSKAETLGKYKFALCFENQILNGWITEKIFDCFLAGTIPIYWGPPDIESYIPKSCFIDMRDFENYEELRSFLKALSQKEIREYRENARAYMESPGYTPFKKAAFTELIARIVEEDTGVSLLQAPQVHTAEFALSVNG